MAKLLTRNSGGWEEQFVAGEICEKATKYDDLKSWAEDAVGLLKICRGRCARELDSDTLDDIDGTLKWLEDL